MPYQKYIPKVMPRDSVLKLADAMEQQLRTNEDKPSWKTQTVDHLAVKVMESFQKANNALVVNDPDKCRHYLVNTANYIMMLRENLDELH